MKYDVKPCRILYKREIAQGIFDFLLDAEDFAKMAKPGQFAHILVPGKTLRRPISICDIDAESGTLRIVFQIRGEGTEILSQMKIGDNMDVLAPLGNGFDLGDTTRKALFVGGGIGVPPLPGASREFGKKASPALGFPPTTTDLLATRSCRAGGRGIVASHAGSMGHHGLVIDCAKEVEADVIFACGPTPMLKAVCELARERGIPCQISLEERMACGIGACLGCATPLLREDGTQYYGHVCKDGPVFDYTKVVL